MMRLIAPALASLFATVTLAQQLEPGEAESRDRAANVAVPKTWSHPANEIRGVWMAPKEMLLPRGQILRKLDQLKAANFNAVLIDAYFRGYVAWPGSGILPQYPEFKGEDPIAFLIDACHQRGLQAHLWMEYGFYAYFTPDATKDKSMGKFLDDDEDLLSIDADGHKFVHRSFGDFYSLCPSNPDSHDLLAKLCAEAVTRYPQIDGLNLDRIRYSGPDYCYCDYCKEHFRADSGIELKKFAPGSAEAEKFLQWKREQTAKAVQHIVKAVRDERADLADLPITSYVVGPSEMNNMAQGWDLWANRGLLDAVAVSMYGADIRPALSRATELLHGDTRRLVAAISCEQKTPVYVTNIEVSRGGHAIGQFTWHLGELGDDDVDSLKAGPYSAPAKSSLGHQQ
jgi:uncharacterized lipoprotein YddW (UPF0748 family)